MIWLTFSVRKKNFIYYKKKNNATNLQMNANKFKKILF